MGDAHDVTGPVWVGNGRADSSAGGAGGRIPYRRPVAVDRGRGTSAATVVGQHEVKIAEVSGLFVPYDYRPKRG